MQNLRLIISTLCIIVAILAFSLGIYQKINEASVKQVDANLDTNGGFYLGGLFLALSLANYINWRNKNK